MENFDEKYIKLEKEYQQEIETQKKFYEAEIQLLKSKLEFEQTKLAIEYKNIKSKEEEQRELENYYNVKNVQDKETIQKYFEKELASQKQWYEEEITRRQEETAKWNQEHYAGEIETIKAEYEEKIKELNNEIVLLTTRIDALKEKYENVVKKLNEIGGRNAIGTIDMVENRVVGMKSRGVYETPGGAILYKAHSVLESICLDKETAHYKALVAQKLAELCYNAQWFTPLTEAILSFVKTTQRFVTGDVKLKLYKGNMINSSVSSPYSLYDPEIATFDEDEVYDQKDSAGFINLYGLPTKVYAKMKAKNGVK